MVEKSHRRLLESGQPLDYLTKQRHLSGETLARERIGYCTPDIAEEFALARPAEWGLEPEYLASQLAGRVIVPIRDDCGTILGVAARSPDPRTKGWWNTPFQKTECVYGMDAAKVEAFRRNKVYLVEGYVDRLFLAQCGLRNTVGIMSTSLSGNAIAVMLRYCDRVCACFDTDVGKNGGAGGGQIGLRNFNNAWNTPGYFSEATAIVLPLTKGPDGSPKGTDPDEFVMENGLEAFLALEAYLVRGSSWRF